ncbi:MAG: hypothetical protein U0Z53_02195 [Blastocatellia bacterium]
MPFRVTDSSSSSLITAQIAAARQRMAVAQERIASGSRINRPSDDPLGAEAVIRLQTSQTEVEQFRRNAGMAEDSLKAADVTIDDYQKYLDRARTLVMNGANDVASPEARKNLATELDGIRQQMKSLANATHQDQFVFGGTRQNVPPYDTNFVPAAGTATPSLLQIEPQSDPIQTGVTADTVFADATGNVFDALQSVITALRGTGDAVADKATLTTGLDRLKSLSDQASVARTRIGASLSHVETVTDRLGEISLDRQASIERVSGADLAESALALSQAQRDIEAILQANNPNRRRSLLDFLG